MKHQLSVRGVVIGCIGCVVITASSIYTALRMGALPWPIIFAAIVSLFFLKLVSRGKSTLNEANVTHTIMSAGAMVAGGLAFTIPGVWMLGLADNVSLLQMLVIALGGSALGLVGSVLLRKHFVEDASLEYPIGQAAAETLRAGDTGGSVGKKLFGSMGLAAVYCFLRDGLKVIPAMLAQLPVPGVAFGIYNSPMSMAVGFLVGTDAVCVWFAGAVFASFGITVGGTALGLWSVEGATQIVASLGMGCMMGAGIGVILKDVLPKGVRQISAFAKSYAESSRLMGLTAESTVGAGSANPKRSLRNGALVFFFLAAVGIVICVLLQLPPLVSVVVVLATFVTCAMSAQSVGQTGIDPMEIFGLIVMLLVALFSQMGEVRLFFVAALVAVACGLAGDVMNDFKAGHILGTSPRAQWIGQAIGAVVGAIVAVAVMQVLLSAYGPNAFGLGKEFVSAQASVVATMVTGIPNVTAFVIGLVGGFVLYVVGFPAMMLGLGIYLPFYMSFTAFIGAMARVIYNAICKKRHASLSEEERQRAEEKSNETGLIIASGLLGGESVMGIILAMTATVFAFV